MPTVLSIIRLLSVLFKAPTLFLVAWKVANTNFSTQQISNPCYCPSVSLGLFSPAVQYRLEGVFDYFSNRTKNHALPTEHPK